MILLGFAMGRVFTASPSERGHKRPPGISRGGFATAPRYSGLVAAQSSGNQIPISRSAESGESEP